MGFSSDIMHDFVAKEIRSIYSSYDGWNYSARPTGDGNDSLAVLERRNNGHRECMKILVTFRKSVPFPLPADLTNADCAADGTLTRFGYAVMVPGNADTSSVPEGTRVYIMKSFAFEGRELAWLKKPVRKSENVTAKIPA